MNGPRATTRKPISYRGFEISVHRERSLGGDVLTYYSLFRESDQLEVSSGFSFDTTDVRKQCAHWKQVVDGILDDGDPHGFLEDDVE